MASSKSPNKKSSGPKSISGRKSKSSKSLTKLKKKSSLVKKEDDSTQECLPIKKIPVPFAWERFVCGARIEDLQHFRISETLDFLKLIYLESEPFCKACNFKADTDTLEEFLAEVSNIMEKSESLVVVEEGTGQIVGLLLASVSSVENEYFLANKVYRTQGTQKYFSVRQMFLSQVDICKLYGTDLFYSIYAWVVHPKCRSQGIGIGLLKAAINEAKIKALDLVLGIFTTETGQIIARKLGFKSLIDVPYTKCMLQNEILIKDPDLGCYSSNVMAHFLAVPQEIRDAIAAAAAAAAAAAKYVCSDDLHSKTVVPKKVKSTSSRKSVSSRKNVKSGTKSTSLRKSTKLSGKK